MDYSYISEKLCTPVDVTSVNRRVEEIRRSLPDYMTPAVYEKCLASIDLTSLNSTDSPEHIEAFVKKAAYFNREFPHLPNVASVCVYPVFIEVAGLALGDSEIAITSVGGGFPSSQTFLEVKMLECAMAEENGADEIDIVMNMGLFREGNDNMAANEIEMIRNELSADSILKVIIESGMMDSLDDVRKASLLSMAAGADFIKTSTGKNGTGATPEAFVVMCDAAKDYFDYKGEKVGVKVAGGVKTTEDAVLYYAIAKTILGDEWMIPEFFRIGASSLANNLLSSIEGKTVSYF